MSARLLPAGSPPRWPAVLPRGPKLWTPADTLWTPQNTDGLFVAEFVEATIRLTKGRQRGELVQLRHWQGDLWCDISRLRTDGRRLYRTYELFISRKNSKSLLGAGIALHGLFDEPGAEAYSAACDKDQAKIVFREVKAAVEMSPELDGMLKVYKDAIEYPKLGSVYRALSSESYTKEGLNPSLVCFDEKHAQKSDELWNVLNEGSGTREQPLVVTLTTKGKKTYANGQDSICQRDYDRAKRIMSGEEDDDTYGCRIYETSGHQDDGFDYRDPRVWEESNPALDDFLFLADMESTCKKLHEADFKTKRLNIWQSGHLAWLPDGAWSACADRGRRVGDVEVVLFLDGSWNGDSTGLVGVTCEEVPHVFVVDAWEHPPDDPHWRVPVVDVEAAVLDAVASVEFRVVEVACDPYRWQRSIAVLGEEIGEDAVSEYPTNSVKRMVPACKQFYDMVVERGLTHDGDPRLARHIGNCVVKQDRHGVRIVKESARSGRKIDLAVCAVGGVDRAVAPRDDAPLVLEGALGA